VEYFHVVFTLPHTLYGLLPDTARLLYDLLFRTTAATLTTFARDPRHLGGDVGVTAVLHTWGQTLSQHIHLHCLVTGGAVARDGTRWIPAKPGFLFPVRALAQVFRAKYLDALHAAQAAGRLRLPDPLAEPGALAALLTQLRHHDWVVYAKRPFAGPAQGESSATSHAVSARSMVIVMIGSPASAPRRGPARAVSLGQEMTSCAWPHQVT
jgi:hypothetical protein